MSGITQVAELLPIGTVIDRVWPNYDYPAPIKNRTVDNYRPAAAMKLFEMRWLSSGAAAQRAGVPNPHFLSPLADAWHRRISLPFRKTGEQN